MKKIIIILVLVLAIIVSLVIAIPLITGASKSEEKTYSFPTTSYIATSMKGSKKVVRVELAFETTNQKRVEYMAQNEHKIRDVVIGILSSRTPEEYNTEEIKELLREEIHQKVASVLNCNDITGVYFSGFIIQ